MKKIILSQSNKIIFRSLPSAAIISFCVYLFARILCYEFPMTWLEEITFFLKVMFTGSILIITCITGLRLFHLFILKQKLRKRQQAFKLANTLFLTENRAYVQHPSYSN